MKKIRGLLRSSGWVGIASLFFQVLATPASAADRNSQPPAGYKLLYEEDFEKSALLEHFVTTDPQAWRITKKDGKSALELAAQSNYQPAVRSPLNIALIADKVFGDFVLEAALLQTSKEYGHRDMCLFFGFQNPTNFYYVHIASAADEHAHNIFVVKNAPRTKIARQTTKGVDWGQDVWHQVRLERNVADGSIKVYFDDMTAPIMVAEDKTFGSGCIGFGSFDDTGMVRNIKVWGRSAEKKKADFFKQAGK
ncbi:MAG: hypothetical protein ABI651_07560 [Verrucomicrobiota bacterium]